MITIIHGEDIVLSRNRFLQEKLETDIILDGKTLTLDKLLESFNGGLFGSAKNTYIENLISIKKNISNFEQIVKLIDTRSKDSNILIWENTELAKNNLFIFKRAKVEVFKLPQSLFAFLDGLKPNDKQNITLFHDVLKNSDSEMIFYMLIRQFRLLTALSDGSPSQIDEIKRLQSWQKSKLERQLTIFHKDGLKKAYEKLFNIDLKVKTGEITNLTNAIDFFLIEL